MMFSHVMVGCNDIERSKRFYDAVLGVLGAGEPVRNQAPSGHTRLFYRHEGVSFCVSEPIDGGPATCANGATIGFKCSSPEQVTRFHDTAVAHGGRSIEEPPGMREGKLGPLYLAYVRDPDGNKLCALHRPAAAAR
jgi:catechol 2,3-dioxygenase-like lactoylglutathione lyase family enzyme